METNGINVELLAIDVGTKRIGLARANTIARIPEPLAVVNADNALAEIIAVIAAQKPYAIIIGLPRDMNLNETEQTRYTRQWAQELRQYTPLPIYWQDEAVTSELAAEYLLRHKLPADMLDAVAACIILQDYLTANPPVAPGGEHALQNRT